MATFRDLLRFEELAQELIEGSIGRLLGDTQLQRNIALQLIRSLERSRGRGLAADRYEIYFAPEELELLRSGSNNIGDNLSLFLAGYLDQAGISAAGPIIIELLADDEIKSRELLIVPSCTVSHKERTQALRPVKQDNRKQEWQGRDAYLIGGKKHIPLEHSTVNVGRHVDNDIVLDGRSVSRHHAQIRWQHGKFVIHDLGSKHGTRINHTAIKQSVLQPGDVITIGDHSFLYGEGEIPSNQSSAPEAPGEGTTLALPGDR